MGGCKGLHKKMELGGRKRTEARGVGNCFPWGSPREVCPPPPPALPPSLAFSVFFCLAREVEKCQDLSWVLSGVWAVGVVTCGAREGPLFRWFSNVRWKFGYGALYVWSSCRRLQVKVERNPPFFALHPGRTLPVGVFWWSGPWLAARADYLFGDFGSAARTEWMDL